MGSSTWRLILLPPLSALALYLAMTYLLAPLYARFRQRQRRNDTVPTFTLSTPLGVNTAPTQAFQDLAARVTALVGRSQSVSSAGEGFLGDEELEEGNLLHSSAIGERRMGHCREDGVVEEREPENGRRLSRELEGGFMDDSSDEEGVRRIHLG